MVPDHSFRHGVAGLAEEGYIFVIQDILGRYRFRGYFVRLRNPRDSNDSKSLALPIG